MKHTTCTLLGLGLTALAPLVSAQEQQTAAQATTPAAATPAETQPAPQAAAPAAAQPAPQAAAPAKAQPAPQAAAPAEAQPAPQAAAPAEAQPAPQAAAPAEAQPAPQAAAPAEAQPAPQTREDSAAPSPKEVKEVFSYLVGYRFGQEMAMQASTIRIDDFNKELFFKAIEDGLKNTVDPTMEDKDVAACMNALMDTLQERAAKLSSENLKKGEAFLKENAAREGVVTTKSGLQYKVIKAGEGRKYNEKKDGKNAVCSVTYEGRLIDGTVFDKTDTPIDMPINRVVPGFSEALKLMPIGSEWEVVIPASLGYGEEGPGIIGNNATLIFRLKMEDIKPGKGTAENPIELTPEILQQLQQQGLQEVPTK